jgi:hypothetical protein
MNLNYRRQMPCSIKGEVGRAMGEVQTKCRRSNYERGLDEINEYVTISKMHVMK